MDESSTTAATYLYNSEKEIKKNQFRSILSNLYKLVYKILLQKLEIDKKNYAD